MPVARVLPLAPDPIRAAASLAGRPGRLLLWDARGGGRSYLACDPIDEHHGLEPTRAGPMVAARSELDSAPAWFGVLPYEGRRELEGRARDGRGAPHWERPLWVRYDAVAEFVAGGVRVIGDDLQAVARLARRLECPGGDPEGRLVPRAPTEAPAEHAARIRAALELIAQGRLYQVNLARRFDFALQGSPLAILARQGRRTRAPYGALFQLGERGLLSTSPELFLRLDAGGRVLTAPIKGTRPRGGDAAADVRLARELEADPKEHAELSMVVDVERNDLGRVCAAGSVRVSGGYVTETHPTLHHRTAFVRGRLLPAMGRKELLEAMLPSGSVTGAPKVSAMQVIARLEAERRGLYTGAFGVLRRDGGLELAMAIRTVSWCGDEAHYFAGGGIVADSDPDREVSETLWKAVQLSA